MKQISLMDSFIKKQKQNSEIKSETAPKHKENRTSEKIEAEDHTPPPKTRPSFVENNAQNEGEPMSDFK